ncbi:TetR/AcrR family transcriptional regulator [Mycobacterium sp. ACS4331]|uniref:TetR/AcrR family transcriptional regulator n=1 Tax=Mycobacterium sp. ACS4331 TaxID=1834121 RepID=UPI00080043C7|nr:TetR/AcrR family transcriptional regulator [Mycobacterium sp. ACS4331]OBF11735.1 hypothetical protein A5727_19765 [Mycobacterium sp. ACS4331]
MSASPGDRTPAPRRADARQNRARILEVASAALDVEPDATLQSIAAAAGVGQATLYRHFPTREALLAEVYRDDFERLVDASADLLSRHEPDAALRAWLDVLAAFGRRKHALSHVLDAATRDELHHEQYDRIIAAIDRLLAAGQSGGTLRPDARAEDVLPLVSFLWRLDTRVDDRVPHLLNLVVDALRVRPPR